jgi:hypothetical protein
MAFQILRGKGWKLGQPSVAHVHRDEWHSKFGCNLCKICWEKYPRAFVKVVEASEISNLPIHHFVHFYSNFWRNSFSNRAKWITNDATSRSHAGQNVGRARARCATWRLPPQRPSPARAPSWGTARLPQAVRTPRRLEIQPAPRVRRPAAPAVAHRSTTSPCSRAPRGATVPRWDFKP